MYYPPLQFDTHYHIYNRGVNSQNLFLQPRNYPYFLKLYRKYLLLVAQTFAYCLLPNHFHFYIRTYSQEEQKAHWRTMLKNCPSTELEYFRLNSSLKLVQPSRAFNNMFIAYARAINKGTRRTGPLFERPFHRKPVSDLNYSKNLVVYIHQNPQKHGLVKDFRDWAYSSFPRLTAVPPTSTDLSRSEVLDWFGGFDAFLTTHQLPVNKNAVQLDFDA